MSRKRKLNPRELRIVVATRRVKVDGRLKQKTRLHVARATVNGHIEQMCNHMHLDLFSVYYFPFLRWIYDNAPMCPACVATLDAEGISPPCSNTGVNSEIGANEDASQ